MGYNTDFQGELELTPAATPDQVAYINAFSATRRMKRKSEVTEGFPDPKRLAVGLPIGKEGGYYVGNENDHGQSKDFSVIHGNNPPEGQPGLWCQWVLSDEGTILEHDGGEKFYNYEEWLAYLIAHFFAPWGIKLNGKIKWQGEDMDDRGLISVKDNVITTKTLQ